MNSTWRPPWVRRDEEWPRKDTWVRPEWMTDAMAEHPAYRVVERWELVYYAHTGHIPTAKTRARINADPWAAEYVVKHGNLPHSKDRARRARKAVQRGSTESAGSDTLLPR